VVVVRDPASEARFGAGPWDRAVLARIVDHVAGAGASAIGLDIALSRTSTPARGGAASDALLAESIARAEIVVLSIGLEPIGMAPSAGISTDAASSDAIHHSWGQGFPKTTGGVVARLPDQPLPGLAHGARAVGHTLAWTDPDGVVRRAPAAVEAGRVSVPAFAGALGRVAGAGERPAVIDGSMRPALVRYVGPGLPAGVKAVAFSEVWKAIDEGRGEILHGLFDDRIAVLLADPPGRVRSTPVGPMPEAVIQLHVLNASGGFREIRMAFVWLGAAILAVLVARLWFAVRWWWGLPCLAALAAVCIGVVPVALGHGVVLPATTPLSAIVLAAAGAIVWNQVASRQRLRGLEAEVGGVQRELATAREALVRQESAVEALEEDLEAARGAVARSTGAERDLGRAVDALRAQLAEARTQEEQTRSRLSALEAELRGLRPGEPAAGEEPGGPDAARLAREAGRVGIVTSDPRVLALFRDLEKAARTSLPILIAGEPGTGKELFARAAHLLGPRASHPFVAVNMAAIPPELFESQLFGHVRGSFTGAIADRKGHFEQADGGSIFLDEIGDLRLDHQSKLLRVLQEKTFHRVGAGRPTTVDVRIVAASNRDLERGIAEGWFREDLFFRLKGLVLRLPPLRERPGDIRFLAVRLAEQAATELGRDGVALSEGAMRALAAHDWPGNVRELQQCLRQAVALADHPVITQADLRLPSTSRASRPRPSMPDADAGGDDAAVLARLRRHGFDMQATARELGWDRSTVTQRLKGLGFRALVEANGDRERAAQALAGDPALAHTVDVKLREYHEHLLRSLSPFDTADAAVTACRRRFKNLPERHFRSLESLVRQHFAQGPPTTRV
jgi:DNA-binding NtrC family response regulator